MERSTLCKRLTLRAGFGTAYSYAIVFIPWLLAVQVYKGRRRATGQITAMKFIVKHGKSEKDIRNLRQEIEILRTLKHENIVQMLDTFETKEEFCVVTEFAQGVAVVISCKECA